jgi:hypothetical protein
LPNAWQYPIVTVEVDMYTISDLRKLLGLETANQVRNRISAIRGILSSCLRHGPNNQILITKEGLGLLRQLQELYDSGLTLHEASDVIRHSTGVNAITAADTPSRSAQNPVNREQQNQLVAVLRDEIAFLRKRVALLEEVNLAPGKLEQGQEWWEEMKHEIDLS